MDTVERRNEKGLTKSEMQGLVEAFARKQYAIYWQASHTSLIRLCDVFGKKFDTLIAKYPHLDLENDHEFLREMSIQAEEWWQSRPMKGPCVDW